jgi:hypothetical protein
MTAVMIKCPQTGRPVDTGLDTDRETFAGLPDVLASSTCPACRLRHSWWRREAWLAAAGEQDARLFD